MTHSTMLLALIAAAATNASVRSPRGSAGGALPRADQLAASALAFFVDHTHPVSGLVRDRAHNFDDTPANARYNVASMAATGFGMAVRAHAATHGRAPLEATRDAVRRALTTASQLPHYHGWLYHFIDWDTGARRGKTEISTIDTTFFIAGALYAAAVLGDPEIRGLAQSLYERLDFEDMRTDGGTRPDSMTLSHGWTPETGYIPYRWDSYAEFTLLILLGLGHPTHPLPAATWTAWQRNWTPVAGGTSLLGYELPLFTHQYSQVFVDHRALAVGDTTFFDNSTLATQVNRDTCQAGASAHPTYAAGFWGLSASDAPDGYRAGAPGRDDGTVCLGCVAASAMYAPAAIEAQLAAWVSGPYGARLVGRYGFADGFNLDRNWIGADVIGITMGAAYLGIANARAETAVWTDFDAIPAVRDGIARAQAASAVGAAAAGF